MRGKRVLVITPPPTIFGGVAVKARVLVNHLTSLGRRVTVAHYATYSGEPELAASVPRLLRGGKPGIRRYQGWDGRDFVSVGSWLPELEFTYYVASPFWRDLIADHDRHIAVAGTVLAAAPLARAGVPHLIWCASDMLSDRIDRRRNMAWPRRLFDRAVVSPVQARLERSILGGPGRVMGVSPYTVGAIRAVAPNAERPIALVPIPTDTSRFHPPGHSPKAGVIGFAGRLSDPRKNVPLLLEAVARLRAAGVDVAVRLAGETPSGLVAAAARNGLDDVVEFIGRLSDADLPAFYRSLDLFVVPSLQEGLLIAGIEAMASGVPVITTRCGGPEAYVRDGDTGFVCGFDAATMANRIGRVVADRELRDRLGRNARSVAETEYGFDRFATLLDAEWRAAWGEPIAVS